MGKLCEVKPMSANRPVVITILAVLQFFFSGFGLILSISLVALAPLRDLIVKTALELLKDSPDAAEIASPELVQGILLGVGVVGIIFSLLRILLGYGLLKLYKWAWFCTLVLQILQALGSFQGLLSAITVPALAAIPQQLFQLLTSGAIIYCLFLLTVRQTFGFSSQSR